MHEYYSKKFSTQVLSITKYNSGSISTHLQNQSLGRDMNWQILQLVHRDEESRKLPNFDSGKLPLDISTGKFVGYANDHPKLLLCPNGVTTISGDYHYT